MRHKFSVRPTSSGQSLAEIELIPDNDKDKELIAGAETATLNEADHEYINEYLTQVVLRNGYSPVDSITQKGNVFYLRVVR